MASSWTKVLAHILDSQVWWAARYQRVRLAVTSMTAEAMSNPRCGKAAHGDRPEEIELLLDGDAPERKDDGRGEADEDHPPVSSEQGEGESGAPADVLVGNVPLHHPGKGEEGEVERPDAQDAADVEGAEIDAAEALALADEQLGDEIGAEDEEEIDAEGSGVADAGQQRGEAGEVPILV